jgi:hypothetical protein
MVDHSGKDRARSIKDMQSDLNVMMNQAGRYLNAHTGPEMGGLNLKQTEAILYLAEVARRAIVALNQTHEDILRLEKMLSEDTIHLSVGDAQILMKKDGSIAIRGKDISVLGSGQVQIRASKDLTLKGQKIEAN